METGIVKVVGNSARFDVKVFGVAHSVNVPISNMPRRLGAYTFDYFLAAVFSPCYNKALIDWMQSWVDREAVIRYISYAKLAEPTNGVIRSLGLNPRNPSRVISTIINELFNSLSNEEVLAYGEAIYESSEKTKKRKIKKAVKESKKELSFTLKVCGEEMTLTLTPMEVSRHHKGEEMAEYYQKIADSCVLRSAGFGKNLYHLGYKRYWLTSADKKITKYIETNFTKYKLNKYAKMLLKKEPMKTVKRKSAEKNLSNECNILLDILKNGTPKEKSIINDLIKNHEVELLIKKKMDAIEALEKEIEMLRS